MPSTPGTSTCRCGCGRAGPIRTIAPPVSNQLGADLGLDAKVGVTQGLTADLTYNTDFAQVEADEQQVNLTRFSLFFPEKREFFTENQGTFTFGGAGGVSGVGNGAGGETPLLFYSRRIGLENGTAVPILGGARLTGRVGRTSVGLIDMQTRDTPAASAPGANFLVLRAKRDILNRSAIGALVTSRSVARSGLGSTQTFGLDGTFGFFRNLAINAFLARTASEGLTGDDVSYRTQLDYAGDRYGVQLERLSVGAHFNPDVGFVRRTDILRNYAQLRFSPRPKSARIVRRICTASFTYTENSAGRLETRIADGESALEFQNSDRWLVGLNREYEFLRQPFAVVPGVAIPVGGYAFTTARTAYTFGPQRALAGTVLLERGGYYGGERTTVTVSRSRPRLTPQVSLEPSLSVNRVDLPTRAFTATVGGARHLHRHAAHVRECSRAVQLGRARPVGQRALSLGVPARQRAVRGLQRRARHAARRAAGEPHALAHPQGDAALPSVARRGVSGPSVRPAGQPGARTALR